MVASHSEHIHFNAITNHQKSWGHTWPLSPKVLEEKLQSLENELKALKSNPIHVEINQKLKAFQDEYQTLKKSTEQVAKSNSALINQL